MKEIQINKIASVTKNLGLMPEVQLTDHCPARQGNVVVVKVLGEKTVYNELELDSGRLAKIVKGDVIAGALGARKALKGYVGVVPAELKVGDKLSVLNLGGVIGACTSGNADVGNALEVELLGMIPNGEAGNVLNIADKALPDNSAAVPGIPLVLISGTCMHSGKTSVACCVIQGLTEAGIRVGAVKISGVACLRDVLKMADHGAVSHASFLDCGLPSTVGITNLAPVARTLLNKIAETELDVIVIEMGDGIIGGYGVDTVFADKDLMGNVKAHIMCANDLVGAWGAVKMMEDLGVEISLFSGQATDNGVGVDYIEQELGLPAVNVRNNPEKLIETVKGMVTS